jgi:hypothetical protein
MGTAGVGLFDDDTACDVRDHFVHFLATAGDAAEATRSLLAAWAAAIEGRRRRPGILARPRGYPVEIRMPRSRRPLTSDRCHRQWRRPPEVAGIRRPGAPPGHPAQAPRKAPLTAAPPATSATPKTHRGPLSSRGLPGRPSHRGSIPARALARARCSENAGTRRVRNA